MNDSPASTPSNPNQPAANASATGNHNVPPTPENSAGAAEDQFSPHTTEPEPLRAPANTTGQQPFAHDPNHEQNELAGPDRGEFGRQASQGSTQGGYGNELSRGAQTYAGSVEAPPATTGYEGERQQRPAGFPDTGNGSYGTQPTGATQPAGSAVGPGYVNDNAAPKGTDSGFAPNYGTSSLGGSSNQAQPDTQQRNQREDYRPGHPEGGLEGLRTGVAPTNTSQGTGEADATPTSGTRSGYQAAGSPDAQGSQEEGFGSKGGSYNDEYDEAAPKDGSGSPARGDYSQQDAARNYGGASDDRTHPNQSPDYGSAPQHSNTPD